ncbi:unnamed protein product [Larinioides sclopetarius]|uniref:Uncharacterized protein n=1 Tax=Larinioides sclopetarius TaxID=280406 RepID=A0AAV1ZTU5_9ARAC
MSSLSSPPFPTIESIVSGVAQSRCTLSTSANVKSSETTGDHISDAGFLRYNSEVRFSLRYHGYKRDQGLIRSIHVSYETMMLWLDVIRGIDGTINFFEEMPGVKN